MEMEFEIENDEAGGKIKIKKKINSAGKIEDMKVWINGQLVQDGPKDPDYSDVPRHLVDPRGRKISCYLPTLKVDAGFISTAGGIRSASSQLKVSLKQRDYFPTGTTPCQSAAGGLLW